MPTKKQRIGASWIQDVTDIVLEYGGTVPLHVVYEESKTQRTPANDEYIASHLSLTIDEEDRLVFRPFVTLSNRTELVEYLQASHPLCHRMSDFHGLYPYILDDLSALIFQGRVVVVEDGSKLLASLPPRPFESDALRDALRQRVMGE